MAALLQSTFLKILMIYLSLVAVGFQYHLLKFYTAGRYEGGKLKSHAFDIKTKSLRYLSAHILLIVVIAFGFGVLAFARSAGVMRIVWIMVALGFIGMHVAMLIIHIKDNENHGKGLESVKMGKVVYEMMKWFNIISFCLLFVLVFYVYRYTHSPKDIIDASMSAPGGEDIIRRDYSGPRPRRPRRSGSSGGQSSDSDIL